MRVRAFPVSEEGDYDRELIMNRLLDIMTDYWFTYSICGKVWDRETSCDYNILPLVASLSYSLPELHQLLNGGADSVQQVFGLLCCWRVSYDAKLYKSLFDHQMRPILDESLSAVRLVLTASKHTKDKVAKYKRSYNRTTAYEVTYGSFKFQFSPPFSKKLLRYIDAIDRFVSEYGSLSDVPVPAIDTIIRPDRLKGNSKSVRMANLHNIFAKLYSSRGKDGVKVFLVCPVVKDSLPLMSEYTENIQ
jgi:hypothetical protein